MNRNRRVTRPPLPIAILLALLVGCATNPATGGRMLSLISERQEIEMGRAYAEQIAQTMARYDDPELQTYVEEIGLRLAAASERPSLPWSFVVLDDPVVNAFAVPGGFLYVTRGILTHFNSEAELAAVLGHEVGHVTARHSVEQLSRQQLLGGLLGIGSILSEDVRSVSGIGATAIGVFGLSHSRSDEHQADLLGIRYALRDGYDPREAIDVHTMLGRQTELRGGRGIPNWLATHPSSADRIDRIRAQVDTIPETTLASTRVLEAEYLAQIDGVVFGANPRDGFFQRALFLHPDLEFVLRMPEGWQTANQTQAVLAQSPEEDAIVQLTLAASDGHAAAAREFFGAEGIRGRGVDATTVNRLRATIGAFEAATESGAVSGVAAFLDHGGRTYRILGYTPTARFGSYEATFREAIASFDRLTDRAALAVQPLRIDVQAVDRATTLRQLVDRRGGPIGVDELAILNGIGADDRLERGTRIKWIVGELPPDGS
ncbi:MAG: M48 family metalloprotease [Gemmatimonadetes bacterium]|nr:M48 family metalloprotease [Gemmatimonadota bacterium]